MEWEPVRLSVTVKSADLAPPPCGLKMTLTTQVPTVEETSKFTLHVLEGATVKSLGLVPVTVMELIVTRGSVVFV